MMHIRAITRVDSTDRYFPARHCVSQEKKPYHKCIHMTSKTVTGANAWLYLWLTGFCKQIKYRNAF